MWVAVVFAALSLSCASSSPSSARPKTGEQDLLQKAASACGNRAREQGLRVLKYEKWTKSDTGRREGDLLVRPEGGGLSYAMTCRYDPASDAASLSRK